MTWRRLLLLLIIGVGAYRYWQSNDDSQYHIASTALSNMVTMKGYQIQALEPFTLKARVLGSKHYTFGRESDLSPVDLALGWGPMADESVIKDISISQSNRWYHWRAKALPIAKRDIETHSANMHMIPATPEIAEAIKRADTNDMIQLTGDLVQVTSEDGHWRWKSSLSREDTGAGACELILVTSFKIL